MSRKATTSSLAAVFALLCQFGCADATAPSRPSLHPADASLERATATPAPRPISISDRCDPLTFNAAVGPGTCLRRERGVTFQDFLAQVGQLGQAPAWHFEPTATQIVLGQSFIATNRGGEVHTFTEVEDFGGGIVPVLNEASGNPIPAPECLALASGDFLAPGGTFKDTPDAVGSEKYQCCIHPWMRATVTIKAAH